MFLVLIVHYGRPLLEELAAGFRLLLLYIDRVIERSSPKVPASMIPPMPGMAQTLDSIASRLISGALGRQA